MDAVYIKVCTQLSFKQVMSDDFGELDATMDSTFFHQVDELTARALKSANQTQDTSFDNFDFVLDDAALAEIDMLEAAALQKQSTHKSTNPVRSLQKPQTVSRQATLFGGIVASSPKPGPSNKLQRTNSQSRSPFKQRVKKTKVWPKDAFKKHGWKIDKKKKGERATSDEEGEDEGDFEQFPNPIENSKS
jgi:hypothetical protein